MLFSFAVLFQIVFTVNPLIDTVTRGGILYFFPLLYFPNCTHYIVNLLIDTMTRGGILGFLADLKQPSNVHALKGSFAARVLMVLR